MSPSNLQLHILGIIRRLQPEAYAVPIRRTIIRETGREISFGTVYAHLETLRIDGLIESYTGPGGSERGWRDRLYWRPTDHGRRIVIPEIVEPNQGHLPGLSEPGLA